MSFVLPAPVVCVPTPSQIGRFIAIMGGGDSPLECLLLLSVTVTRQCVGWVVVCVWGAAIGVLGHLARGGLSHLHRHRYRQGRVRLLRRRRGGDDISSHRVSSATVVCARSRVCMCSACARALFFLSCSAMRTIDACSLPRALRSGCNLGTTCRRACCRSSSSRRVVGAAVVADRPSGHAASEPVPSRVYRRTRRGRRERGFAEESELSGQPPGPNAIFAVARRACVAPFAGRAS